MIDALFLSGVLLASVPGLGTPPDQVDYESEVKPILELYCYECHGPLAAKAGLRLDSYPAILKGSDAGTIIEKGQADESILMDVLEGRDGMRMPPEGEPVPGDEIQFIRRWIDEGAKGPADEKPVDPTAHWAFLRPTRPELPAPADATWARNPIDLFLRPAMEAQGLKPAPEADRATLMRRVSLDLTGLAPTRDELHAFLADSSPDAYEKLVDRLLASPAYGERWGRHWMDVWRYSDWYGFGQEVRNSQPHIWQWRDWIIESLNKDTPYDQMIVSMLAADEATPTDADSLRATGYLARSWYRFNRNVWLENAVEHTGKAFLGLTINCAKCHDHKYDPITQADFYRFRAIFEPHDLRTDTLADHADPAMASLVRAYDAQAETPTYLFENGEEARPVKDAPIPPGPPEFMKAAWAPEPVALPARAYYPGLWPHVQKQARDEAEKTLADAREGQKRAAAGLAQSRAALEAIEGGSESLAVDTQVEESSRFLSDDFQSPRPDLWTQGNGAWAYGANGLKQTQVENQECGLVSTIEHPRDFRAEFRFRTTGGSVYKSVGLTFDRDAQGDGHSVYLSAHDTEAKLQLSHRRNGASSYPGSGLRKLPITTGREYDLRVDVVDRQLNVYVDGILCLVTELPGDRKPGVLSVWTFDASAEFLRFTAGRLDAGTTLVQDRKAERPYTAPARTVEEATAALRLAEARQTAAERDVEAAETRLASLEARIEADAQKYADSKNETTFADLSRQASQAERTARLAAAKAKAANAELAMMDGSAGTDAKRQEAEKALETARKEQTEAEKALTEESDAYSPISPIYPAQSTGRRLALARWIASTENPLTARVAVNQIWMRHLGAPLVASVFDFGRNGARPVHPELLDWLAVEFMENGWRMKPLHRLIVTSTAYRLSSAPGLDYEPNTATDPSNAYFWKYTTRRMESEIVRDNVLHLSSGLDPEQGGPELDPKTDQTTPRRSLYFRHAPEKQSLFLQLFDAPNVNACYRRDESIVPQQALAMANSELVAAQSRILAGRLAQECPNDEAMVQMAFEIVLGRLPGPEELRACLAYLDDQAERLASPERLTSFSSGSNAAQAASADPRQRAREGLIHVLFNHNDFLTIR